jgi:outer membrane murein-binding lipoprotein Lpp
VRVISFLSGCNPNQNYIFSFPVYLPSCLKEPEPTVYRLYLDEKKEAYDHPVNELNRKIHTISEKLLANRQAFDAHKEDLEALEASPFIQYAQELQRETYRTLQNAEASSSPQNSSYDRFQADEASQAEVEQIETYQEMYHGKELSDFNKKCQALRAKVGACESEIERLRSEKKASFSKEP